ncbi:MAG: right-handed parallel beta-helix repeat-containing protein [Methanothrix sp.]|nr:right-handed parallel beta-helix repeat-containing protein [Methanothrix sp.]
MDYNKDKLETLLKGLLILILLANCADAATLTVGPGQTYTTIQSAINAASPGDTILVQSGTYNEHVVVNKQLTLRGVGSPVVDAGGSGDAITISYDGCTLEGFVAKGSGAYSRAGIKATSSGNTLSGNTATGNSGKGIYLSSSSSNTVSGNTATGNSYAGILLESSSNGNTLSGNTATGNYIGILLESSSNGNTLSGNTATGNTNTGIRLDSSSGNTLSGNTATGNSDAFNHIGVGIVLSSSSGNTLSGNTVTGNTKIGILITFSSNGNTISGNTVTGNDIGIYLYFSSNGNTISGNTVTGNDIGIYLDSSSSNTIYLNTLDNARSNGDNHWNATTTQSYEHNGRILMGLLGNIWSDYTGFDCDGIGDTSYLIPGGSDKDYHPIGGEEFSPDLEAQKSADRTEAYVGDWINYRIWVNNTGKVSLTGVRAEDNVTGAIWNVGTLLPGQNFTNTTRYQVKLSDLPGPLTNELRANGTADPCGLDINDSATETVNILYRPDIQVDKSANLSGGSPSTILGFKIEVNNSGNADFASVDVEDLLPPGLDYVSDDSGVIPGQAGSRYIWNLGPLNSRESLSFNLTAHINGKEFGDLVNAVNATGYPEYGDPVNSSATASVRAEEANITVTKVANPAFGSPGTNVTFNLTVTNSGSAPLPHVSVSDLLPAGLSYVSSSPVSTQSGQQVVWPDVGPLATGTSSSLEIVARIDGPIVGMETLTNRVDVQAEPEHGENVTASAIADVLAEEANITVTKVADPAFGSAGTNVTFNLTVTNSGSASLPHVSVSDLLPAGLSYVSSSPVSTQSGQQVVWPNVGPLATGTSSSLELVARIDGPIVGMETLTNRVDVQSEPEHGENVTASAIADVLAEEANITVTKTADPASGLPGTPINFTLNVTNSGRSPLLHISVSDLLPAGLAFVSSSSGAAISGQQVTWQDAGPLAPGASRLLWISAGIDGSVYGTLTNRVDVTARPENGDPINAIATADVQASENLILVKTADKPAAHRGEDITYTVTFTNPNSDSGFCFTNVTVWDELPREVELVSASPETSFASSTLTWDIGTMCPGDEFVATIVVRIPLTDINYDMSQGVTGKGFVNVHNDYDTHQGPESITNCAYAKADLIETLKSCASTRIVDPGTELKRREFGSGTYDSEELLRMRTENKSIKSATSLSAVHQPTSFALPQNRSIDYGTKWTEKSKGINTITGATMNEEYTFASKIDKERSIELDKNGSTMKTEVEFEGTGHIGVLKKADPDSHPKVRPIYEAGEDYVGSFHVYEMVDEYGQGVSSNKSVAGYGYVAVDKRVRDSQRTYESGTGSYQSDEIIDTPSNYIAKDIKLVHGPTGYSYTPRFGVSQNMLWSEGMWSKSGYLAGGDIFKDSSNCGLPVIKTDNSSPPASYISERFSSLDSLKKETIASGLNEMKTNASFSGMADFKVKSRGNNRTSRVDNEERYVGQYDITRKVLLTGVSRYDRPHITVKKEGNMTTRWFNKTNAQVAKYVITITNDGNVALAPINVRDIFPPGTEYIGSSIRPASLSRTDVNWTLVHIGIGNTIKIELELNLTEYAPGNIVNRVMVCGMNGDACVSGAAYAALESAELPCCLAEVGLDKRAVLDATDPTLVHFTIQVRNNADSTLAATLNDTLPAGLTFLSASAEPSRQEGPFLQWIVPDLKPGGAATIEYQARATRDGSYVNSVHLDATAVDGTGYDTADASARVEVRSTGVAPRTTRYGGWQPPEWNITTPDQGITVELSPDEDTGGDGS